MPTTDLLERARSASSLEEECAVIDDAIDALRTGHPDLNALAGAVARVRIGECPRPVLLGVVAALKPEHLRLVCGENVQRSSEGRAWAELMVPEKFQPPISEGVAASPALALLIAILEASHAD